MKTNEQLQEEFQKLAQPLMDWMLKNYHPHTHVYIDNGHAEISEGLCVVNSTRTRCKECVAWGNTCGPDDYPSYINDPDHCEYFELPLTSQGGGEGNSRL